jgi:hypothetical protein
MLHGLVGLQTLHSDLKVGVSLHCSYQRHVVDGKKNTKSSSIILSREKYQSSTFLAKDVSLFGVSSKRCPHSIQQNGT